MSNVKFHINLTGSMNKKTPLQG